MLELSVEFSTNYWCLYFTEWRSFCTFNTGPCCPLNMQYLPKGLWGKDWLPNMGRRCWKLALREKGAWMIFINGNIPLKEINRPCPVFCFLARRGTDCVHHMLLPQCAWWALLPQAQSNEAICLVTRTFEVEDFFFLYTLTTSGACFIK